MGNISFVSQKSVMTAIERVVVQSAQNCSQTSDFEQKIVINGDGTVVDQIRLQMNVESFQKCFGNIEVQTDLKQKIAKTIKSTVDQQAAPWWLGGFNLSSVKQESVDEIVAESIISNYQGCDKSLTFDQGLEINARFVQATNIFFSANVGDKLDCAFGSKSLAKVSQDIAIQMSSLVKQSNPILGLLTTIIIVVGVLIALSTVGYIIFRVTRSKQAAMLAKQKRENQAKLAQQKLEFQYKDKLEENQMKREQQRLKKEEQRLKRLSRANRSPKSQQQRRK